MRVCSRNGMSAAGEFSGMASDAGYARMNLPPGTASMTMRAHGGTKTRSALEISDQLPIARSEFARDFEFGFVDRAIGRR